MPFCIANKHPWECACPQAASSTPVCLVSVYVQSVVSNRAGVCKLFDMRATYHFALHVAGEITPILR
jgi:hypothetical protein